MSVSATIEAGRAPAAAENASGGVGQWLIVAVVVVLAGVLSGFYAVNEYAGGTKVLVDIAKADSERFETIYRDTSEKRLATLRYGLDILRANKSITDAFARDDRAALQAKVENFFKDVLHKTYEIDQLNFFTPPAIVYLRADNPKVYGNDLSSVRKTIVVAGERRQMVSGMETGLGGVVALRAVAPILDGARLVGTIGVGDAITHFLDNASTTAGLGYAQGLDRAVAERAERAPDPKNDAIQDGDVFVNYSSPEIGQIVRGTSFKPRSLEPTLLSYGSRTIFMRNFALNNFAGVPTVVVATIRDLSEAFADVRDGVAIKAGVLFLVLAIGGSVAVVKFRAISDGLKGAVTRQKIELEEVSAQLAAAQAKLKVADQIKSGFFTNLVLSLNQPLRAVVGQLQTVTPAVDAVLGGANAPDGAERDLVAERLRFALSETSRFSRLVADHRQLEEMRRELATVQSGPVSLAAVVATMLEQDLALAQRLPHLSIRSSVDDALAPVRGHPDALRRAVANLVDYAAQGAGRGTIQIAAKVAETGDVQISITGTAFQMAGKLTKEMLNEAHQFLWRLSASPADFASSGSVHGVLQAQAIILSSGGKLDVATDAAQPGFVVRLPLASPTHA